MEDFLREARTGKLRSGKSDLLKYLQGKRITRNSAIKAKCYDCDGFGDSGECNIDTCSLFPYSPYSKIKK